MLGVYMAMPVLSHYAEDLPGATPMWIGLSVGAYGLTQALFQIPLAMLGDRIGRGRSLALGLAIFGLGSAVCARAATAPILVLGRLVQGAGAMASTMIALLGDRTREAVRTRAMASTGIFIGGAFAVGLVLGPVLSARFGVPWLFGFSALASAAGLALLPLALSRRVGEEGPGHDSLSPGVSFSLGDSARSLLRPALLAVDLGILTLHMGVTSLFVLLPLRLKNHLEPKDQWKLYLPALVLGFIAMAVAAHAAESRRGTRAVLAVGSAGLVLAYLVLARDGSLASMFVATALFVTGFACMEPALAAQVTRHSSTLLRGTAAGIFNTVQFVGVFLGGLLAGAAYGHRESWLFVALAVAQVSWLVAAWRPIVPRAASPAGEPAVLGGLGPVDSTKASE